MSSTSIWHRLALTAIDLGRQTRTARFLPDLDKSQWLPTTALAEMQIARLQQILTFASQYVPFYRRLFYKNRWNPRDFCALKDLERLPVITKDILRSSPLEFRPQGLNFRLPYKSRHTGGSTGEPLPYRVANDAFGMRWAATLRVWQAAGYVVGDRMLTLGGASLNSRQRNTFAQDVYNALRNNYAIPVGKLDAADLNKIVAQINAVCPSLLYGYPSIIYLVARHIIHHGVEVHPVDRVITTSELLFPGQRKLIEQAFHAPVFDEYGCPEASLVAGECGYHCGLHYAMEICLVEVLDDNHIRLPAGHTGHLVATNLVNRATCLIRYDTGDYGAVSNESCKCGRGLLLIKNLEGRNRDMIFTPDKKYIHGVEINHLIYRFPWVDRYQIVQETSHDLTLTISASNVIDPSCVEKLCSQLAELTGMTISVSINAPFIETDGKKNRLIISKIRIPDEAS